MAKHPNKNSSVRPYKSGLESAGRTGMRLSFVVLLILFFEANVCGQSTTGTLVGTVTDASGAIMSGVSVVVTDVDTNYSRTATTSESGVYSISNLQPANYRIEFQ